MSNAVEARPADFTVRATRLLVKVLMGTTRLMRRPPRPPKGVEEHAYGTHPRERLEWIAPADGQPPRAPVVYVHGGGWIAGEKHLYTRYLTFLAEAGYPVVNLGYPLAPENPHPGILRSLLAAMDWIRSNHPEVTGFHVMGDSAGGNLAMMLGLLAANADLVSDVDSERVGGVGLPCHSVVSLYGVLDRLSWLEDGFPGAENMLESYGGQAALEPEVGRELALTPMDLDFASAPACLLTVGTEDQLRRSSQIFADRLAAGPGKVIHKEYPGEGHGFLNLGRTRSDGELREDILAFLDAEDPNGG